MDPYDSPLRSPQSSSNNQFPHSLLRTRQPKAVSDCQIQLGSGYSGGVPCLALEAGGVKSKCRCRV